ncbi:MAG: hypothetical protein U5S82_18750 [Gammaproteobacteria bacterium]|nr:hypothetical protein [Gammaproteobacteria bacterium]
MTETLTTKFDSATQMENAVDDLLATGIPDENIRRDWEHNRIAVIVPETARPEIEEILKRHQPAEGRP